MRNNQSRESLPILEVRHLKVERGGAILLKCAFLSSSRRYILSLIGPNGAGKRPLCCKPYRNLQTFLREKSSSKGGRSIYESILFLIPEGNLPWSFKSLFLFDTTVFDNIASGLQIRRMKKKNHWSCCGQRIWIGSGIGQLSAVLRNAFFFQEERPREQVLPVALANWPECFLLMNLCSPRSSHPRIHHRRSGTNLETDTNNGDLRDSRPYGKRWDFSDRIAVMRGGKTLQIRYSEEVMNHPADEFVASFVRVETVLTEKWLKRDEGALCRFLFSGHNIEAVGKIALGESVALCNSSWKCDPLHPFLQRGHSARKCYFQGKIMKSFPWGFIRRSCSICGFPLVPYITNRPWKNYPPAGRASRSTASFKATAIHVV